MRAAGILAHDFFCMGADNFTHHHVLAPKVDCTAIGAQFFATDVTRVISVILARKASRFDTPRRPLSPSPQDSGIDQ